MKVKRTATAALAALLLTATACRSESSPEASTETTVQTGGGGQAAGGDSSFGSLDDVCQPGDGGGATAQGVTESEIQLGVMTDFGFTQNPEFLDAAEVFTQWCNDAGGVNGRQLTFEPRDAKLFEYRQRVLESCREDFMLVGGGASFDGNGVRDRLQCGLVEIPAQTVMYENTESDLQVLPVADNPNIGAYEGYYEWLLTEQHPETAGAIGIIAGDVGITRLFSQRETETIEFLGGTVVYNDVYPASGFADCPPYAQALKSANVQGLVFLGSFDELAKLEQALVDVDHTLVWIDANTNAYNPEFVELGGAVLDQHTNYAAPLIFPIENADQNPATQELLDIFEQYKPDANISGPMVQAWSAWLLFATSARECGADLTRRCVFDNASAHTDWDGGGLHAPTNLADPDDREVCFVVMQASSSGWTLADFAPNEGPFRCKEHEYEVTFEHPEAATLEDVGLTLDDIE